MAEKLSLEEDTGIENWIENVDDEMPPWDEETVGRDEVQATAEETVLEEHEVILEGHELVTDILEDQEMGEAQTVTVESAGVLAVHQTQVRSAGYSAARTLTNEISFQAEANNDSDSDELTPSEAEARKKADAVKTESLKLRNQLHEATQETRVSFQKVSALRKKLVTAQQAVTSQRASMGRKRVEIQELEAVCAKKREEFREMEVKELTWMQRENTTNLELIGLEEAYAEKTCMGWDLMTRLTSHMSGATMFGAIDIRARQERKVEEKLAMEMAALFHGFTYKSEL